MDKTLLSSKGQIILPKAVREAHRWAPGTAFSVEDLGDGVLLRPIKTTPARHLDELVGCLNAAGTAHTLEEMDAAIETELRARRDCGRY